MSKGSAKFTEADVRRVIKGARQAGAERVEVDLRTGRVAVILSGGGTMIAAEETAPAMAEWDDVLNEKDKHHAASASEDDAKKRQ
jgi:hypothetical protein